MNGYTGTRAGEPAGVVHPAEFFAPCSCGGIVYIYDEETVAHSREYDPGKEHVSVFRYIQ